MAHKILKYIENMWTLQSLSCFCRIGADELLVEKGQLSLVEMASLLQVNQDALYRLLRVVCVEGYVKITSDRSIQITEEGRILNAMRATVISETDKPHWVGWGNPSEALQAGNTCLVKQIGMGVWDFYRENQKEGDMFAKHMSALSIGSVDAVLNSYDFNQFSPKLVVDVGGSEGIFLKGVLRQVVSARGILFDLPEVIAKNNSQFENESNIDYVGGSFFEAIPSGCDAYLLKFILHDWGNEQCILILSNIAKAMNSDAKIYIVEIFLNEEALIQGKTEEKDKFGFAMDMNMLINCDGGRERSIKEYSDLLDRAGLRLNRTVFTQGPYIIIEAEKNAVIQQKIE